MEDPFWNKEKLERLFSPGQGLDILLSGRVTLEEKAVRRSKVLGLQEGDLALTMPNPPLPQPLLGREVEVTVLSQEEGRIRRYGFQATVLDLLPDYADGQASQSALVVMFPQPEDLYPTSLRKAKRYKVPEGGPLQISLEGRPPLRLLDVSVKGLRFLCPGPAPEILVNQSLPLTLTINDQSFTVNCRVAGLNPRQGGLEVSAELGILHLDVWTSLLVALHELEHNAQTS